MTNPFTAAMARLKVDKAAAKREANRFTADNTRARTRAAAAEQARHQRKANRAAQRRAQLEANLKSLPDAQAAILNSAAPEHAMMRANIYTAVHHQIVAETMVEVEEEMPLEKYSVKRKIAVDRATQRLADAGITASA